MSVQRRRSLGGVLWGVVLVAVGMVFLLINLGYSIPIWTSLVRYWPVLIIVWGLAKLADYYRFRNDPAPRSLFTGGEIVFLIFMIFMGSVLSTAANLGPSVGRLLSDDPNVDFNFDLFDAGTDFEFTDHVEADMPAGSRIEILNRYGAVEIQPGDTNKIVVDIKKVVRATDQAEADRLAQEFTFSVQPLGSGYRLVSSKDPAVMGTQVTVGVSRRYRSSLVVKVPKTVSLVTKNRNGAVTISGIEGNQEVENRYGPVTVRTINGNVTIENRNGAVEVLDLTGDAKVENSYGSVSVKNISGTAQVENRHGSIDVADVKGRVTLSNRYASISLERIAGEIRIDGRNNGIDIEHAEAGATIETSYRQLTIRDARGPLNLKNRHGDILVSFEQPPQHDLSVTGEYSDVTVQLPSASQFSVEASTSSGSVESEFDQLPAQESGRNRREGTIRGQIGAGGPKLTIQTRRGNVQLQRRG